MAGDVRKRQVKAAITQLERLRANISVELAGEVPEAFHAGIDAAEDALERSIHETAEEREVKSHEPRGPRT